MYSVEIWNGFFDDEAMEKYIYKNNELVAIASFDENGNRIRFERYPKLTHSVIFLTRAQGFKYWEKYFPNRTLWSLPETIREACELEATFRSADENCEYWGQAKAISFYFAE